MPQALSKTARSCEDPTAIESTAWQSTRCVEDEPVPDHSATPMAAADVPVIDDDTVFLCSLTSALESQGIAIATARDGLEGLNTFRISAPKVVLTDIIMPNQDGMGVIMAIRRECPDVKIIAMSGGGRVGVSDFLTIAKQLGADAVIEKPFDVDKLIALIRTMRTTVRSTDRRGEIVTLPSA